MVTRTTRFAALLSALALCLGGLIALTPASANAAAVVCKIKGKKVTCPTAQLKGPRGPAGQAGQQGPQGPPGNGGGVSVIPFKFLAVGNTSNTTIATFVGAVAESGCSGAAFTSPRLRSTADNGAGEVLNLRTAAFSFDPDLDTGQSVNLAIGVTDQHGMTYMSANGTQVVSAHYSAYANAGIGGQFDCAIFGTAQVG